MLAAEFYYASYANFVIPRVPFAIPESYFTTTTKFGTNENCHLSVNYNSDSKSLETRPGSLI